MPDPVESSPPPFVRPANLHVSEHPAVLHKLALLRDERTEPKKFRELVREISWLIGYEALADAHLDVVRVRTPLEMTDGARLADRIGLIPILRAGLGMLDAMLELMPTAQVWHLGLFRDERTLRPVEYYNKLPDSATVDLCLILVILFILAAMTVRTLLYLYPRVRSTGTARMPASAPPDMVESARDAVRTTQHQ